MKKRKPSPPKFTPKTPEWVQNTPKKWRDSASLGGIWRTGSNSFLELYLSNLAHKCRNTEDFYNLRYFFKWCSSGGSNPGHPP